MSIYRRGQAEEQFIVFATIKLADARLEAVYDNLNALRSYFRNLGRMVHASAGRKANASHAASSQ